MKKQTKEEEKNNKEEFLSKVSHDMRTPLNAVLGMSNMILRATDKGDVDINEIHNFAEDIKNAGEELLLLTSDYLYISDVRPDQNDISNDETATDSGVRRTGGQSSYKPLFYAQDVNVLIVDDNSVNRKVFRNLLRDTGVSIEEAGGGYEGVAKALEKKYDIIFLDYMMPDQDGIGTLQKIRSESESNRETPVIALTASTINATMEKLKSAGFDGFISKPLIPGKLEKIIADNLPKEKIKELNFSQGDEPDDKEVDEHPQPDEKGNSDQLVAIDIAKLYANDKEELDGYYRDIVSDTPDSFYQYMVKVHSMKTSALMVKAYEAWALAKNLEEAAENENRDFIQSVHPIFIKSWMTMGEQLEKDYLYSGKNGKNAEPEYEIILNYLELLSKAVEEFDVSSADTLLDMIRSYKYPDALAGLISRLNTAVAGLNGEDTRKYISEIRGMINENYIADRKN